MRDYLEVSKTAGYMHLFELKIQKLRTLIKIYVQKYSKLLKIMKNSFAITKQMAQVIVVCLVL